MMGLQYTSGGLLHVGTDGAPGDLANECCCNPCPWADSRIISNLWLVYYPPINQCIVCPSFGSYAHWITDPNLFMVGAFSPFDAIECNPTLSIPELHYDVDLVALGYHGSLELGSEVNVQLHKIRYCGPSFNGGCPVQGCSSWSQSPICFIVDTWGGYSCSSANYSMIQDPISKIVTITAEAHLNSLDFLEAGCSAKYVCIQPMITILCYA